MLAVNRRCTLTIANDSANVGSVDRVVRVYLLMRLLRFDLAEGVLARLRGILRVRHD